MAGFQFLIALGSLIGLFGLVVGALLLFFGGRPFKSKGLIILLIRILLVVVCARNKILFQLGYPGNQIFTGNMREREMLLTLWERYALVITNAERYLMKTADDNI